MSLTTDPTYLRSIYDGLSAGSINKDNATALPIGLVGVYEEALPPASSVNERKKFLEFFAVWAIIKKEVSVAFVLPLLEGWTEEEVVDYIGRYSKWFNSPESGKYIIYHERFRSFLLSKLTETEFYTLNQKIINLIESSIYAQDSFEHELYGLEFLSLHVKLQFHWRKDEALIVKLKEISETDFLKRQVKISKKFKWTNNFWTDLIYMAEFIDEANKYRYYYDLFKSFLDEDNYINEVMLSIEDYDISIILETIEKLEFESLYDKKKQLSICLYYILSLLQDSEPQIDKIVVLCRKLEDVIDATCFEHEDERINFLPLPLILVSGAKLLSLGVETSFPNKLMQLNFYAPFSIDYTNLLAKVKLNKTELINYLHRVIDFIKIEFEKSGFILFDYEENNQEDPQFELDKIYQLYKELKYLIIDHIDSNSDHQNYFNMVLDLLHRVNEKAAEDYISKLPSELQADMVELIYNKLEELDCFQACLFVSKHFLFFDVSRLYKTIDIILDAPKYDPTSTIFLLNNIEKLNKDKLNSYYEGYYKFAEFQEFNSAVMYDLIQVCFVLYDFGQYDLIKKTNRFFESELDRLIELDVSYCKDLYFLSLLYAPQFHENLNFDQITRLTIFAIDFVGDRIKNDLASKLLAMDLDEAKNQYAIKNDWDNYWEWNLCEMACKLGIPSWLIEYLSEVSVDNKLELFFVFKSQLNKFDLASKKDIIMAFKKQKFAYSDPSSILLEIELLSNLLLLECQSEEGKFNFLALDRGKKTIFHHNQVRYLYNVARVHLLNSDVQAAVDILPYVGNYYKELTFDIGFAFLELERDFTSFISLTMNMIAYFDEEFGGEHNNFDNYKLDLKYGIEKLEKIILHASNDSISSKKLYKALGLLFTSNSLLNIDNLIEIQNFKSINSDYLNKLIVQIVNANTLNMFYRIRVLMSLQANKWITKEILQFFRSEIQKESPDKRDFNDLVLITRRIQNKEEISKININAIWLSYLLLLKDSTKKLLLLGLLSTNENIESQIFDCIKKVKRQIVKTEKLKFLTHNYEELKSYIISPRLIKFSEVLKVDNQEKIMFHLFIDEDTGEETEIPQAGDILGDNSCKSGDTIQLDTTSSDKTGIWISDNTQVATVDLNGLVTAINNGKTKITYTVKAVYSDARDTKYKIIKVLSEDEMRERLKQENTTNYINNELSKRFNEINFSVLLFKTMNNRKLFFELIEKHAIYRSVFPDEYTGYQEISQELIDLSWLNDN